MNFGIKSSFFNGLVFAFSKDPGPLYKVCHKNATAKEFFLLSNVFWSFEMGTWGKKCIKGHSISLGLKKLC